MTTHHHTWCIRQSRVLSALHYVPKLSWFWICDSPFYRFSYCSLAIILPATPCCSKCLPGFNSSPCLLMFCSRSSSISPGLMQGLLKGTCSSASHLIPNQPTHYGQDKLASVKLHSHQCLARKTAGDSPPPACWIGVWFSTLAFIVLCNGSIAYCRWQVSQFACSAQAPFSVSAPGHHPWEGRLIVQKSRPHALSHS